MTYACALDVIGKDGLSLGENLSVLLRDNKALESYFKQVATGNPLPPENTGLRSELLGEIATFYSPEATVGCKNDANLDKLASKSSELLKTITNF